MRRRPLPLPLRASIALALLSLALVPAFDASTATAAPATKTVAKQVPSPALGKRVLATTAGRTLYSLSAETKGRFICTGACLSTWQPLLVPAATRPKGPVTLDTIQRPDGRTQVTFKGRPLYSFSGDSKSGDANGEGIADVGTWHAAVVGRIAPQPQPQPQPESPTYPY